MDFKMHGARIKIINAVCYVFVILIIKILPEDDV
jgi:hypothetical protein